MKNEDELLRLIKLQIDAKVDCSESALSRDFRNVDPQPSEFSG